MRRRTISLLLCLMMVVSLFAGCLTSASAAELPGVVTAAPATATIKGTGSASFSATTALNGISDKISADTGFDLGQMINALKEGGLQIDQITQLLDKGGVDWTSILGGLQDSDFSINEIVDMLKGDDSGNGFDISKIVNDLKDSEQFADLMDLIKGKDNSSLKDTLVDFLKGFLKDNDADASPAPSVEPSTTPEATPATTPEATPATGTDGDGKNADALADDETPAAGSETPAAGEQPAAGEGETPAADDSASKTLESIKKYLKEALKDRYKEHFTEAEEAKIDELFEKIKPVDGKIDMDSLVEQLQTALGDKFNESDFLSSVIKAFNGDPDGATLEELLNALVGTANGDAEQEKTLNDMIKQAMEQMGQNFDADTISGLIDALAASTESNFDAEKLINGLLDGGVKLADLISGANSSDSGFDADKLVDTLLARGVDLSELISALKANGEDDASISDMILNGSYTYTWYVRTATGAEKVELTKDKNTYAGFNTKTLTVTRSTAPTETETYVYYCVVHIDVLGGADLPSNDVTLTITPEGAVDPSPSPSVQPSTEPTTAPTSQPTAPVLDNEKHIAYIKGYEDGTVRPNNSITRAEVAQIFFNLMTDASKQQFRSTSNTFKDVSSTAWYNEAVSTLARASVLQGYEDGTFLPDKAISRAEMATILTRVQVLNSSLATSPQAAKSFPDVAAGSWYYTYVQTASRNGWINGYEDGTFRPDSSITRAETVTMVNRLLSRNPQSLNDMIITGMNVFKDNTDVNAWYFLQIQEAANGHDYSRNDSGFEKWTAVKN